MKGSKEAEGIIPLAIRDVFTTISQTPDRAFQIRVSYLEIYNEIINDLLDTENKKLKIREDLSKGVYVEGAKEEEVSDVQQVLRLMERGEHNRHFGATNMNERSSRSHTIFRITIESMDVEIAKRVMEDDENLDMSSDSDSHTRVLYSTLNLVDLAGSERVSNTLAEGQRLKEGAAINKSLFTLGKVISKLSEGNSTHIPYRDSKLTRILQSALGGNSKTVIICTVTPALQYFEETQSTLSFANRAKSIQNSVTINEILGDKALLKKLKKENAELKTQLLTEVTRLEKEKKDCVRQYEEKISLLQSGQTQQCNHDGDEQEKASLKKLIQEKEKDIEWIQALSKSSQQRFDEEIKQLQHTLSTTIENSNHTISSMKLEQEKIIAQLKQEHENELTMLKSAHQTQLEELTLQLSQKYENEKQETLNSHHALVCELKKQISSLQERIEEMEICKEGLEAQIQTLNENLEMSLHTDKLNQQNFVNTNTEMENLQQQLTHLTHSHKQEVQSLLETIEKLQSENQSKEFETSSLKEAVDSLSQLLKQKEEEMEELEYDFGLLQSQFKQQEQKLESFMRPLQEEDATKSTSHLHLEELLQQKDHYISQLKDEITLKEQAFKREIDDAVEKIKELEEEKESIVTGMSSKLEEMNRLLVENKALHKQNEELKSKIEYGKARSQQRLMEERKRKEAPPLTPHDCNVSGNSTPCSQEFKKCKLTPSTPPSLNNHSATATTTTQPSSKHFTHHYFMMNTSLEKLEESSSSNAMTMMNKENKIN